MTCRELEQFLYPYLDGEFGPDERLEVEHHLAACQACALKLHQESRFLQAIRQKAREGTGASAPRSLRDNVLGGVRREQRQSRQRVWLRAAAAVMVVVGAASAYWALRTPVRKRFLDDATHWYAKRYPHEIQPGSHAQAEAWFHGKLEHRVPVPRLPNARLEGARLAYLQNREAAYIGYETVSLRGNPGRIGVFVFNDSGREVEAEPHPSLSNNRGYQVAIWRDGEIVYELVSDLDEADIRSMLQQLQARSTPPRPEALPLAPVPSLAVQPASYP